MHRPISYSNPAPHGFTLIELAIVLVIIGLIIGGILVGRDLIRAAEIRATVQQFEKFNSAVNTFRTKYNCLPGDCASATSFGLTNTYGYPNDGDGNGLIGLCNSSSSCVWSNVANRNVVTSEYFNFWYHLNLANLVETNSDPMSDFFGPYPKIIPAKFPNFAWGWYAQGDMVFDSYAGSGRFSNAFVLGTSITTPSTSDFGYFGVNDIYLIDQKIDDGLPTSGSARAFFEGTTKADGSRFTFGYTSPNFPASPSNIGVGGPNTTVCARNDVTPTAYNIQGGTAATPAACGLAIKAAF